MAEPSDVERLTESSWSPLPALTQSEAIALEALGSGLSATDNETGQPTSVIQCRYTTSGTWEVRVADAIGLIGVGSHSWPVEPKIDKEHLFYLLQRAQVLPRSSTQIGAMASGKDFWHLVYDWFLTCTERLLRGDLAKGYSTASNELPYVRGTLDPLGLSRGLLRGHTRVRCTYEEFTADIAVNRVVKAALLHGLGSGTLQPEAARRSRRLLERFAEVGPATAGDLRIGIDRQTSRYREPLLLAHHILRGLVREISIGSTRAWCFLWRTPEAVELGVREVLRAGLGEVSVNKESRSYPPLSFTPDLVISESAVGDIKYSLDSGSWERNHVYQLLSFAVSHRRSRALLVNFHTTVPKALSVDVADTALLRLSWRLDLHPDEAGHDLILRIEAWLSHPNCPAP